MKLPLIALFALPVLVSGIALTTAVAVLGTAEAPTPTPTLGKSLGDRANRANTAGAVPEPGDGTRVGTGTGTESSDDKGSGDDTEIDGRRPHLTVIDGRPSAALPGAIPGALSVLPPPLIALPPLTDLGGDSAWRTGGAAEPDDRPDDTASSVVNPDSSPHKPRDPSQLSGVPGAPSQTDDGAAADPGPVARPPAGLPPAGRPGRPPSDTVNMPFPSDSVGLPGGEDTGRPPTMAEPEPLTPGADPPTPGMDLLTPGADLLPPDTVVPAETAVPERDLADTEGSQPDEMSDPTAKVDLDDSQPPIW